MSDHKKQTLITDYFSAEITDYFSAEITDYFSAKITDYFNGEKKNDDTIVYGYNEKTGSWHCLVCGVDMGPGNPRQLCEKSYCPLDAFVR